MKGWGNAGWKYRLQHLQALSNVYRNILRDAGQFTTPFQLFLHIDQDAGQDAVYVHTPNPNRTPFPCRLTDAQWGVDDLNCVLLDLLPAVPFRVGVTRKFDPYFEPPSLTTSYVVYSPGTGVPLE